jgi:hypothetical protein
MVERQDVGAELQIASVILEMGARLLARFRCEGSTSKNFGLSMHLRRGIALMLFSYPNPEVIARSTPHG